MSLVLPVVVQLEAAGPGTAAALWASRVGAYLALTVVVGCLVSAGWLVREDGGGGSTARLGPTGVVAMRVAAVAAAVWALAAGGMLVFGLANATARPVSQILDIGILQRFLVTRYGSGVTVQAAVAIGVCLLAATARDRGFARVTLVGAAAGALALAASGHAATAPVPPVAVASNTLHILAVALWVGGLLALIALVMPRTDPPRAAGAVARFSRLAGWALAAVLVTGAVNSLMHVDEAGQLLDTTWGRLVLLKLALFAGIAALGWWNRRRVVPRVGRGEEGRQAFRRVAVGEICLMLAAFGAATGLATGTPAGVEAAARVQSVRVGFGDGLVELTLAPARAGVNELHVYFFDDTGGLRETDDASITLTGAASTVEARLIVSGPGHYTGPAVDLREGGTYTVAVEGLVEGERETATTAFTVR